MSTVNAEELRPRTEAGRRLYDSVRIHNVAQRVRADDRHDARWLDAILDIEDEARSNQLQVIERDRLDAAWADAEAALPGRYDEPDYEPGEGGPSIRLTLESHAFVGAEHYEAVAFSEGYTVAASASGDTPAAALRNLLSALDSTTGDERG